MKTFVTKKHEVIKKWYILDATDIILGKLAVKAADVLRGKNKAIFSPATDAGDFVIVINSDKIKVTGGKEEKKMYHRHSGYPGGLTSLTYAQMMEKDSTLVIKKAVKGMLPKNKLAEDIISKLKIYPGAEHPHEAQKPERINI